MSAVKCRVQERPSLILLGPRGSGKTTLGQRVAQRLGVPFIDLDQEIQAAAGRTIAEIFAAEGEAGFRDRETAALRVAASQSGVIATGGGVIVRDENRTLLKSLECPRVFLVAEPETLYARIAADQTTAAMRPALTQHRGVEEVRHLLEQRLPLYREVATCEIDVSSPSVEAIVERLLDLNR